MAGFFSAFWFNQGWGSWTKKVRTFPEAGPRKKEYIDHGKKLDDKKRQAKFQVKIEKFFCITRSFLWDRDPTELMMFNSRNKCEQNLLVGGMISLVGTINKLQGQGRKL